MASNKPSNTEDITVPLQVDANEDIHDVSKAARWYRRLPFRRTTHLPESNNDQDGTFDKNDAKWLSLGTEVHCTTAANTIGVIKLTAGVFAMVVIVSKLNIYEEIPIFSCLTNFFVGGCTIIGVCEEQPVLLWVYLIFAPLHVLKLSIYFLHFHLWRMDNEDIHDKNYTRSHIFKRTALIAVLAITFLIVETACYYILLRCTQYIHAIKRLRKKQTLIKKSKKPEPIEQNVDPLQVEISEELELDMIKWKQFVKKKQQLVAKC